MKILWISLAVLIALYGIGRGIEDITWFEVIVLNVATVLLAVWALRAYAVEIEEATRAAREPATSGIRASMNDKGV